MSRGTFLVTGGHPIHSLSLLPRRSGVASRARARIGDGGGAKRQRRHPGTRGQRQDQPGARLVDGGVHRRLGQASTEPTARHHAGPGILGTARGRCAVALAREDRKRGPGHAVHARGLPRARVLDPDDHRWCSNH
eukprot:scaffold73_cov337-Pavlova_lutheri.AAC.56